MTVDGKRGNPNPGFPLFPPPLEIASAIPTFPQARRFSLYSPKAAKHPSEKCYLCRRAKMSPMSPAVPTDPSLPLGMTSGGRNSGVRMKVRALRGLYGFITASFGRGSLSPEEQIPLRESEDPRF